MNRINIKKSSNQNGSRRGLVTGYRFFLILLAVVLPSLSLNAQWVNDPAANTRLATETIDPINISAVNSSNGGLFLVWEDGKKGTTANIFYQFIDKYGRPAFKGEGKSISDLTGKKVQPVTVKFLANSAIVIWKDYTNEPQGNLVVQRIFSNGNLGWSEQGLQLTGKQSIYDYSVSADSSGNVFAAFVEKAGEGYKIIVQKISENGYIQYRAEGITVHRSASRNNSICIIADERGGAFLFWLDNASGKSQVAGQHIDSNGKNTWGKTPNQISSSNNNVLSFTAQLTKQNSVYIAWQAQSKSKDILHQLVNIKGKGMWGSGGKLAAQIKGNQLNPNIAVADSALFLSWTNDYGHNKDIFIQKYRYDGKPLWKENGLPVLNLKGEQFGQKMVVDQKNGIFIAWVDKRNDTLKANIYGQKINRAGKFLWDSLGMPLAKYKNSDKSYLTVLPDNDNGIVVVFKDKRGSMNGIYGQKVFNASGVTQQPIGLRTRIVRDSVSVSWYNPSESFANTFTVQKLVDGDLTNGKWVTVATIPVNKYGVNSYEVTEKPRESGVQTYRIEVTDREGNSFMSEASQVNYFASASKIILGQNTPNPFTDFTEISFYLPASMRVSFEFYNSKLETVREISGQYFEAGENKIAFNADNLPAGIYFYRLKAGDFVDVRKMVLVR